LDAEKEKRHRVWRTVAARVLHNQVGHAFRRATAVSKSTKCWDDGKSLAGRVSRWCKQLDCQLSLDEPGSRPRSLAIQVSDATTAAPQDARNNDDGLETVSCATTSDW